MSVLSQWCPLPTCIVTRVLPHSPPRSTSWPRRLWSCCWTSTRRTTGCWTGWLTAATRAQMRWRTAASTPSQLSSRPGEQASCFLENVIVSCLKYTYNMNIIQHWDVVFLLTSFNLEQEKSSTIHIAHTDQMYIQNIFLTMSNEKYNLKVMSQFTNKIEIML